MARHKSFTGGKSISDFEPISFDLRGQTFRCNAAMQGAVLLDFVARADSESGGEAAGALYGLFEDAMPADEYTRLRALLNDPNVIIEMETIAEIASWLVEQYTARPTKPSENSGIGLSNPGHMQTAQPSYAG